MVRLAIKGGVWKNSEDELLKAAIMKYGLNNWARVASLLPRKTAKQTKARWFEWLDPSIKKTEWTREEEERLLHLAKLMPAQWRTIAPMVGRTAAQCLEHYEKLLDAAQARDGEKLDARDDPRRLRPGEIDPAPETKPARPDPVDMDEDEKEMLSEARARLANTKGKKAKRKAREKQLQEAKRLASLQKLRELKAAGLDGPRRKRKRADGLDTDEIPLEHSAPAGFFDTTADDAELAVRHAREKAAFKPMLLTDVQGQSPAETEAREKARDRARMRKLTNTQLPAVLAAEAAADPMNMRKRSRLSLPAPQLSDGDLEALVKMGREGEGGEGMLEDDGAASLVTSALLPEPSFAGAPSTVGAGGGSIVRGGLAATLAALSAAKATATSRDALLEEARNQAAMNAAPTPLFGGENAALAQGTGYGGVTPQTGRREAAAEAASTALASVLRGSGGEGGPGGSVAGGRTPMGAAHGAPPSHRGGSVASRAGGAGQESVVMGGGGGSAASSLAAGMMTRPLRDAMGINRDDEGFSQSDVGDSASVVLRRGGAGGAPGLLALSFAALPAPRNAYEIVAPEEGGDDDLDDEAADGMVSSSAAGSSATVRDAAEAEAEQRAAAAAAAAAEWRRRSSALRHDPALPRPLVIDEDALAPPGACAAAAAGDFARLADLLVRDEMVTMLKADAANFPIAHRAFHKPKRAPVLEAFSEAELSAAGSLVAGEASELRLEGAMQAAASAAATSPTAHEGLLSDVGAALASDAHAFGRLWSSVGDACIYLPASREYVPRAAAPAAAVSEALRARHSGLAAGLTREATRLQKMEAKLGVLTRGYELRAAALNKGVAEAAEERSNKAIELSVFTRLAYDEAAALPARLQSAQEGGGAEAARERELQGRYTGLMRELEALRVILAPVL